MRRVLLIKLTSLGDLIHALPALSDAQSARPGIEFDWVIDESFQEIAAWHPAVRRVITTNHREWRGALASAGSPPDCRIRKDGFIRPKVDLPGEYLVFVHNASWKTKLWPERHWIALIGESVQAGFRVLLPWGNTQEEARAKRLAIAPEVQVLPRLSLSEIGYVIERARACVCMDTGLSHLAAALDVPSITLYGSTDSGLIGASGASQVHLKSDLHCSPCREKTCRYSSGDNPCLEKIGPERVFGELLRLTGSASALRQVPVSPVSASAQRAS